METEILEIAAQLEGLIGRLTDASITQGGLGDKAAANSLSAAARCLKEARGKCKEAQRHLTFPAGNAS